jgi:hypothetical protein
MYKLGRGIIIFFQKIFRELEKKLYYPKCFSYLLGNYMLKKNFQIFFIFFTCGVVSLWNSSKCIMEALVQMFNFD